MKKKLWYTLLTVVLIVVLAGALAVGALADDDVGMDVFKQVNVLEDGTYTVDLEAFATGTVSFSEKNVPVDLILVLDVSGSMEDTIYEYKYNPRSSQAYSYSGYGNNTYYYLYNGNYYPVTRERTGYSSSSYRYNLHFTVGSTTYYLSGTGVTTTNPNVSGQNTTIWTGVLYTRQQTGSQTKIAALRSAVNGFIDVVAEKNQEVLNKNADAPDSDLSRVSIVKFAGTSRNGTNYQNYKSNIGNETYRSGQYTYNYTQVVKDLTVVKQAELTTGTNWHGTVNGLSEGGATSADYGMGYANAVYNEHKNDYADRQTVIVMFTDGEPNHSNNFDNTVAKDTVNTSRDLKAEGVKVFSVAILQGADPKDDPGSTNVNKYLHAVSSNYKTASATVSNNSFNVTFGDRAMKEDGVTKEDYYFTASSSSELSKIFTAIAQSSASSTSQVGAQSVMKDIVSSSFTLPEGANVNDITVTIVPWDSETHDWSTSVSYTTAQWKTECMNYLRPEDVQGHEQENIKVDIKDGGSTIDITGFNYAKHFKATKTVEEDHDGANMQTAKLVVSFPMQARPSAVTGGSVATNGENSGIYLTADSETALIKFDVPHVVFQPVTYVVDYVTSDTSTDTKASTIKLDYSSVLKNVERLDEPNDPFDVLIGELAVDFNYTIYKGKYGTISFGDDATDVQRRYVRYAPTTMNWNDYDRIFVMGESATEDDKDVWAMLCVLPANSVFYEDTYITQTKKVTYNDEEVTIKYTGINYYEQDGTNSYAPNEDETKWELIDDSVWSEVGTEGKNQTYHAGDDMGWITGLADDSTYANDMAHKVSTSKAKATFTFSGTGVDIYSRTNGTTGTVMVSIKSPAEDNESNKKVSKTKIVDTKAAAGDFFAIPVCTFTDLPYGKYTVTITVTTGGQAEGRMTFYLDGVRVYNPIKPLEGDGNVAQMYGAKNMGAVFTEVRSLLGTGAEATALYIDEHTVSETVTDLDAIEAAAKALAKAQDDRDAYVENTITPAKNAISAEEYAKSSAESALTSATNVYNAAKDAYDAAVAAGASAEDIAALEATMNAKKGEMDDAQAEYNAAVEHYDANIGTLQSTLDTAIANKAPYDKAVDDARDAYDDANDGVTLEWTTNDVALYNKEGPKSEVLLDAGEQVAINVESGKYYYIGLRSLNGDEVTVLINGTEKKLSHSTDLYYECTPTSGTIVIENNSAKTGDGNDMILSVTKLRATGTGNTTSGAKLASTEETLAYVRSLATASVTGYTGEVLTDDETGGETTGTEPADETVTETTLGEGDIEIENPDPEPEPEAEAEEESASQSAWSRFISSFFGFFRH